MLIYFFLTSNVLVTNNKLQIIFFSLYSFQFIRKTRKKSNDIARWLAENMNRSPYN